MGTRTITLLPMHNEIEPGPGWPPVVVADARSFMRGCLGCCLDKFASGLRAVVTADAVMTIAESEVPNPGAVVLSASALPAGRAWLEEQVRGLRSASPTLPILALLDEADSATGQELALTLGLQGYIPMSSSLEIAIAALRLVMAGGHYYPHVAATSRRWRQSKDKPAPARAPGNSHLTPRERAVFHLLSAGLPNKLIARELGMAVSTVKIHVHHILKKLNVQNRTEVAISGRIVPAVSEKPADRLAPQQILVNELR
jgi:DNA-binding NarL/FixJ family response regulator